MAKTGAKPKKKKPRPKLSSKKQSERFIEMARTLGIDEAEGGKRFNELFTKVAKPPK